MNKLTLLIVCLATLALTACTMPDIGAFNTLPAKTDEMSANMKAAFHKQILDGAQTEMFADVNIKWMSPIPTGILAQTKVFAEEIYEDELVQFFHLHINELNDVIPANGLDKDSAALNYTEDQADYVRLQKTSRLTALMAIAYFAQDDKIEDMINKEIKGRSLYQKEALEILALRGFFAREVMVKLDLKVSSDYPDTLDNAATMNEAILRMGKLEKISRQPFADKIVVNINDTSSYKLVSFQEAQDKSGRQETADTWNMVLNKSLAGIKTYSETSWTGNKAVDDAAFVTEVNAQAAATNVMQSYVNSWKATLQ